MISAFCFVTSVVTIFFSRTLTSVHNAILDDLCYPAEIVGKRTRVRLDGSHLIKVQLDKNQQTNVEHKVRRQTATSNFFMFYNFAME